MFSVGSSGLGDTWHKHSNLCLHPLSVTTLLIFPHNKPLGISFIVHLAPDQPSEYPQHLRTTARHPIFEERPLGRHRERPDNCALGRTGGTDLFDVTIFHPLSQTRIRDAVQNPLNILKAALAGKVSRYAGMVHEAGRRVQLLPVPISTLGGWHPDAHRALSGNRNCRSWSVHIQLC